jgi:hypothetical protein
VKSPAPPYVDISGRFRHQSGSCRLAPEVRVADSNLTQEDANTLLAMEKHKADDASYEYPSLGGGIRVPLLSPDKRESFFSPSHEARSSSRRERIRIERGVWRYSLNAGDDYARQINEPLQPRAFGSNWRWSGPPSSTSPVFGSEVWLANQTFLPSLNRPSTPGRQSRPAGRSHRQATVPPAAPRSR